MENISVLLLAYKHIHLTPPVVHCLGQIPGVKVFIVSKEKGHPLKFSRYCHGYGLIAEEYDLYNLKIFIKNFIFENNIDFLLPVHEEDINFTLNSYSEFSNIVDIAPLPTPEGMKIMTNKWKLSQFLYRNNIPHPKTILYDNTPEFKNYLDEFTFPIILKPILGAGGTGIIVFSDEDILMQYLHKNPRLINNCIIQNYINGNDIDCSVLCKEGDILAYTIQKPLKIKRNGFTPSRGIEFVKNNQTYQIVKNWAEASNWTGIAHIDLRHDNLTNQISMIEVNARYWGSLLGSLSAGINFPHLAFLTGKGIEFKQPEYSSSRFVYGKETLRSFFDYDLKLKFNETNWKYVIKDPLPEGLKLFRKALKIDKQ